MTRESRLVVTDQEGVTVVGFAEPTLLSAYHINEIGEQLYRLVEKEGHRLLVLDLSTIKMLSSQALGVFLNLKHKLEPVKGRLALSGIDPQFTRVFKITRLEEVFEFFDDKDSAVNRLKGT